MKSKKFIIISIILLSFILIFQTISLLKNSFANRLLNPRFNVNWNNYYNMIYGYSLEASKFYIENLETDNIFILLGNSLTNYTEGLDIERGFTNVTMYPAKVVEVLHLSNINEEFVDYLINKNTNYVIMMGKNETFHNVTTTYDVNIYEMDSNGNLLLRNAFNNDLYNLSYVFKKNNQEQTFNEFLNIIKKMTETYWFSETINALKELADKYYENEEYDRAIEYYQEVLKYGLNKEIFYNLGDIYFKQKNYNLSLENFNYCKSIDNNFLDVEMRIKEVGELN